MSKERTPGEAIPDTCARWENREENLTYWEQYWRRYWSAVDALFSRTISYAERAFGVSLYINIVIVIVGIALLTYSMIYSWINGLDLFSTAFGSLGVINFIAVFYLTPQRKIQVTVGDLTQMQILYRSFYIQLSAIHSWQRTQGHNMTLDDLDILCKQLKDLSNNAAQKIEDLIGKK